MIVSSNKCGPDLEWRTDTTHTDYQINNDGATMVLVPQNNQYPVGILPNHFYYDTLGTNKNYCMHSLHFHWSTDNSQGSEHTINGKEYPLCVHFVHFSCDYATLTDALTDTNASDPYVLAVVGVIFELDEEADNSALNRMLADDVLDAISEPGNIEIDDLELFDLVPDDIQTAGYYHYEGSLTTPPYNEVVRWHVSKSFQGVNSAQMEKFREMVNGDGNSLAPNWRPPQFNVNNVFGCLDEDSLDTTEESYGEYGANTLAIIFITFGVLLLIASIFFGVMYCKLRKQQEAKETQALIS